MTNEQILFNEFDLIRMEIIELYDQRNRRASGRFAKELEVESVGSGLTVRLYGTSYTEYVVEGRGPGKAPPVDAMLEYVENKRPTSVVQGLITASSLAYLIGQKIAREGTEIFKQGGSDLISSIITPERIQSIIDKVSALNVSEFTSRFVELFQEIAV